MKKTWAVLLSAAMAVSMAACSSSSETEETAAEVSATEASAAESTTAAESVEAESAAEAAATGTEDGELVVGFDQEFPPMGFVGDDGEYTGFDLELAAEAAERMGLTMVPQPINWDAKDMELESGNVDCIWNGFTMQGREDDYTWVGPYMSNQQVFVVAEDSDINTIADLAGKAVEVQKDSSGLAALNDEANAEVTASFASLVEVADYNTALMDLEAGACDAVCMDVIVAGYQITSSGKPFRILDEALSEEEYGIGLKKGNEALAERLESVLLEMKEDGTMAEISEKWFAKDVITLE